MMFAPLLQGRLMLCPLLPFPLPFLLTFQPLSLLTFLPLSPLLRSLLTRSRQALPLNCQ
jgi:hypothetical protein